MMENNKTTMKEQTTIIPAKTAREIANTSKQRKKQEQLNKELNKISQRIQELSENNVTYIKLRYSETDPVDKITESLLKEGYVVTRKTAEVPRMSAKGIESATEISLEVRW